MSQNKPSKLTFVEAAEAYHSAHHNMMRARIAWSEGVQAKKSDSTLSLLYSARRRAMNELMKARNLFFSQKEVK